VHILDGRVMDDEKVTNRFHAAARLEELAAERERTELRRARRPGTPEAKEAAA
jgi:hypothetical protein